MNDQRIVTPEGYSHKPVWFRALNTAWRGAYVVGAKANLKKDHLIQMARKETGLREFGADFWEEPLDRLLDAIEKEADLHPIGRFITQQRMKGLLATRLRAEELFRKKPEILEQELYPVQLICGLQRTGTTKLQRLLSGDTDNRVLYSWEALSPVPLNDQPNEMTARIKAARMSEQALRLMSPGFFSIHPVEYQKPEEDILLLDTTFMSTTPEATMHVPSYAALATLGLNSSRALEETNACIRSRTAEGLSPRTMPMTPWRIISQIRPSFLLRMPSLPAIGRNSMFAANAP